MSEILHNVLPTLYFLIHTEFFFFWVPFKKVDEEPNRNYFGILYLIPEYINAVWELIRSLIMGYTHGPEYKEGWLSVGLRVVGLAIPGISAHSPTNYVNSVRLGRDRAIPMATL